MAGDCPLTPRKAIIPEMKRTRRIAASPLAIFAAAVTTRLAVTAYTFRNYYGPEVLFMQNESSHIARSLVAGLGFSSPYANVPTTPTAQQPPLYPLVLAGIFRWFGTCTRESAWAAVSLNIVAAALTAVLLYYLGKAYFSEAVGMVAAWAAVLPWMSSGLPLSVSLSSPFLAALGLSILLLLLPRAVKRDRGWLALGVYAGLLVLLQTTLLSILAAYGVWLALCKARSRRMLWALAALLLTLLPWTIRNYVELGRLIPIRDNFGLELWLGNRPGMRGTVDYNGDFPDHDPSTFARLGELRFMDAKFAEAKAFVISHPVAFFKRCLRRAVEFWYFPNSPWWGLLSALGWVGAILACRKHAMGSLLAIPLFVFPPVYYVTHLFPIYRYPIDPLIILLAAYAVKEMVTICPITLSGKEGATTHTPTGNGLL